MDILPQEGAQLSTLTTKKRTLCLCISVLFLYLYLHWNLYLKEYAQLSGCIRAHPPHPLHKYQVHIRAKQPLKHSSKFPHLLCGILTES